MLAHLSRGHKLQWPERGLHVWDVGLQIVEGVGDVGLELGWTLARRAGRCDLVEGGHDCGRVIVCPECVRWFGRVGHLGWRGLCAKSF